ncbi:MAG: MFS transporter, partial [Caldilinea sp.]
MQRPMQRPAGMAAFSWIWAGQFVSLLASAMTRFALTIWAFQETGQATALALVGFFAFAPTVLFSPLAGALVDRWNRKLVLILSDLAAGLATVALLLLYNAGELQIWHLYVANAFAGTFEAFQFPAFSAAMSLMVPQQHYGRANGLVALTEAATGIAAPLLAGILLAWVGLRGVMAIDVVTFVLAIAVVLLVTVPQPKRSEEGRAAAGGLWAESFYGFRYIWERKGLLGVQLTFAISNFFDSSAMVLVAPLV